MDFRHQTILWSGSSAVYFEILYRRLIMRILMSTFRYIDSVDHVIFYHHQQKDLFHISGFIWLMWKYVFELIALTRSTEAKNMTILVM